MIFKLSMRLDVSLSKILLGVAGCSVAVCAYKFYYVKKDEQTASLKSEVIDTCTQEQNISAKSNENGHVTTTLNSKKKLLSNNEPSLNENKQKF